MRILRSGVVDDKFLESWIALQKNSQILFVARIICNNPGPSAEWFLETAVVKTSMYYEKINVNSAFTRIPTTGNLCVDIVPQKDIYGK